MSIDSFYISFFASISIAAASAYLGSLMLAKRMVLAAEPIGHLTLPGVALALIYGWDISLAAIPFVVFGVFAIWVIEHKTKLSMESVTGIVFASGTALAFLVLPVEEAETALVGDISSVGSVAGILSVFFSIAIIFVLRFIFRSMVLINISEEIAKTEGINAKKINLVFLGCVAAVVVLGVKIVGGLLTAALVVIPAATSRNLFGSLAFYTRATIFFGVVSAAFGVILTKFFPFPAGPMIILSSALFFIFSVFSRRIRKNL